MKQDQLETCQIVIVSDLAYISGCVLYRSDWNVARGAEMFMPADSHHTESDRVWRNYPKFFGRRGHPRSCLEINQWTAN